MPPCDEAEVRLPWVPRARHERCRLHRAAIQVLADGAVNVIDFRQLVAW